MVPQLLLAYFYVVFYFKVLEMYIIHSYAYTLCVHGVLQVLTEVYTAGVGESCSK
jgi:hypothetical protein